MTKFSIQHNTGLPDRVFISLDDRFDAALIRTELGLRIEVYPITDGEVWCDPSHAFDVDEAEILELEKGIEQ